jgi:hypothetical protein
MANIIELRKSKGYRNYKSLNAALYKIGHSLEEFTDQSVKTVHQKISQKLGVTQLCNQQCSRNVPNQKRYSIVWFYFDQFIRQNIQHLNKEIQQYIFICTYIILQVKQ